MARVYALLLIPVLLDIGFAINFYLPVNSVKCLREGIQENMLVAGEYELSEEPRTTTELKVRERPTAVTYGKHLLDSSGKKEQNINRSIKNNWPLNHC